VVVQVFFLDSLKVFLSLYGHKLAALAMDISSDSTLLVSGGADKNIRVWGLDFGDCHRSIFAHGSNVTQVGPHDYIANLLPVPQQDCGPLVPVLISYLCVCPYACCIVLTPTVCVVLVTQNCVNRVSLYYVGHQNTHTRPEITTALHWSNHQAR
jgi:hypothetical protein